MAANPYFADGDPKVSAYIYRCRQGHESAVTELEMTLARVAPTCTRPVTAGGQLCGAELVVRLRPFSFREGAEDGR